MKQPVKPSPQVRAGVDVGATELVVAILRDGQPESPCTVPNTPAGHRQLLKLLTRRGAHARVCLEATGVYSLHLALALQRAERVEVMVVNPRAIKDFQRARLTRAKTDRVDALGILEFLQIGETHLHEVRVTMSVVVADEGDLYKHAVWSKDFRDLAFDEIHCVRMWPRLYGCPPCERSVF